MDGQKNSACRLQAVCRAVDLLVVNTGNGCVSTPTKAWLLVKAQPIEGTEANANPSHAIRAYTAAANEEYAK